MKILELLMSLILTRQNWNWPQIVFATKNSRKCDRLFCRCWPSAGCAAVCMRLCISRSCAEWGDAASADCTPRRSQAAVTRCPAAGVSTLTTTKSNVLRILFSHPLLFLIVTNWTASPSLYLVWQTPQYSRYQIQVLKLWLQYLVLSQVCSIVVRFPNPLYEEGWGNKALQSG